MKLQKKHRKNNKKIRKIIFFLKKYSKFDYVLIFFVFLPLENIFKKQ